MINLLFLIIGLILGLVIDKIYLATRFNKYERGFESIEHYHLGILLIPISFILNLPIFLGLGVAFIIAEWEQEHYFAYNSNHFKNSSIIGVLCSILAGGLIFWAM